MTVLVNDSSKLHYVILLCTMTLVEKVQWRSQIWRGTDVTKTETTPSWTGVIGVGSSKMKIYRSRPPILNYYDDRPLPGRHLKVAAKVDGRTRSQRL